MTAASTEYVDCLSTMKNYYRIYVSSWYSAFVYTVKHDYKDLLGILKVRPYNCVAFIYVFVWFIEQKIKNFSNVLISVSLIAMPQFTSYYCNNASTWHIDSLNEACIQKKS